LERLAQYVVRTGDDPGKWVAWLMEVAKFRRDVWPTLDPDTQRAVIEELRRRAGRAT
jgi:hypothetical protein